jgi:hypothetical protein
MWGCPARLLLQELSDIREYESRNVGKLSQSGLGKKMPLKEAFRL